MRGYSCYAWMNDKVGARKLGKMLGIPLCVSLYMLGSLRSLIRYFASNM